ncbi:MAG: hypothetical protein HC815_09730 [Richelia sp. RM1_1_1]|nr:hypothetical protein [Richelia sp. RM1_1_1]
MLRLGKKSGFNIHKNPTSDWWGKKSGFYECFLLLPIICKNPTSLRFSQQILYLNLQKWEIKNYLLVEKSYFFCVNNPNIQILLVKEDKLVYILYHKQGG